MIQSTRFILLLLFVTFASAGVSDCFAQNRSYAWRGNAIDYQRMNEQQSLVRTGVVRDQVQVKWMDGDKLWYLVNADKGKREIVEVDYAKGTKQVLEKPPTPGTARMLSSLAASVDRGGQIHIKIKNETATPIRLFWIDRDRARQSYGEVQPNDTFSQHTFIGHVWLIENEQGEPLALFAASTEETIIINEQSKVELKAETVLPNTQDRRKRYRPVSPDGKWKVVVREHNLFLKNQESKKETQLTKDGTEKNFYSNRREWSPDSKRLIVQRVQPAEKHSIYMVESAPKNQEQPKLHSMRYLKPGDDVRRDRPYLFDVENQKQIDVSNKLFDNPYQLREGAWTADGSEYRFVYNQRGHQVLRYIGIDGQTGKVRAIIDEISKTFVDYAGKYFLKVLEKSDELIWMSERDGWNHLYLIDAKTGKVKNQITKGEWVIRGVERIDEKNRRVYFRMSGWHKNQDPYYIHYGHIGFNGKDLVSMTDDDGTHSIEYSPDGEVFVDTFSRVDLPPVRQLRRTKNGKLIMELEKANARKLIAKGWVPPQPFVAKGRDGKTDIHGVIYFPSNMDRDNSYPVIEYIYAGPHDSFVPKKFFRNRPEKAMTELGFIVVQIDGMGTSNRSKAFHDVCWKNLGDSGFPDRIAWMKAAKDKYPQMNLNRVGIFGGSAGGQSALRALLAHPRFYKAAVSDCGCHDNRMDKIWWNELWMSWPIGPHYEEQSNVTNAHHLFGKLLLIVGELDRNVDPASTMQVVDALIKADKDFELLVVPGAGHGIGSGPYGTRRTRDFFVRNLLECEPRAR